jgi:hypothetical protein
MLAVHFVDYTKTTQRVVIVKDLCIYQTFYSFQQYFEDIRKC